jgi:zinc transport system substrate-binding protein
MSTRIILNVVACVLCAWSAHAFAQPQVVVSIKPLHSLVAGVMSGVGEPALIIDGTASPHRYRLKPSQAKALSDADLIFWIGPELETFMRKPIEQLAKDATSVALIELDAIEKLDVREDHGNASHEGHDHGETDPHIWLDPDNAAIMVNAISAALSARDTANAKRYAKNASGLTKRLTDLAKETEAATDAIKGRPFLVFHDSYQYFEKRFGLRSLGAILNRPDVPASAKRISDVRSLLQSQSDSTCVFTEPQFNEGLAVAVAPTGNSTIDTLDPLGSAVPAGPDHYIKTVVAIRDTLVGCLNPER